MKRRLNRGRGASKLALGCDTRPAPDGGAPSILRPRQATSPSWAPPLGPGLVLVMVLGLALAGARAGEPQSGLRFDPETNSYAGLTFTFDPRLDKQLEWLHFEHWLSIMQHSSSLLFEALNGRAHLAEVRVLIPYRWRQAGWPVLHKPGSPIIMNRRLKFADSDVIVGFEGKFRGRVWGAPEVAQISRPQAAGAAEWINCSLAAFGSFAPIRPFATAQGALAPSDTRGGSRLGPD